MTREDEVAQKVKFTAPEEVLLDDHLKAMGDTVAGLRVAVGQGDGVTVMRLWNRLGDSITYVGTILNLKGNVAAKQWLSERGEYEP